jgi:hypothetical protein
VRRSALLVAATMFVLLAACTSGSPAQHTAAKNSPPSGTLRSRAARATEGVASVVSYRQACAKESGVCAGDGPSGTVPPALNRPLHFPVLRPDEGCPVSDGSVVKTEYLGGIAFGNGPVRLLINSALHRRGIAELISPTSEPPWLAVKTTWFSVPAYKGPFMVRAGRLGGSGPARVVDSSTAAPLVVPPGATINGGGGWREAPGGFWVRSPGCYAFQVDGLTFSYVIVVHTFLR